MNKEGETCLFKKKIMSKLLNYIGVIPYRTGTTSLIPQSDSSVPCSKDVKLSPTCYLPLQMSDEQEGQGSPS